MRANATEAEKVFWEAVRNRKVLNKKFNRKFPIFFEYEETKRFFIADFRCHECKLIVEIDGGIHKTQKEYDFLRTTILTVLKFTIIRYKNEEVLGNLDSVIENLKNHLLKLTP